MPSAEKSKTPQHLTGLRRFAIAITILNILGHTVLGFEQSWAQPVVALVTAYSLELLLKYVGEGKRWRQSLWRQGWRGFVDSLLSAHISGLAVAMLLYTNERLEATAFASAAAIGSKAIFRVPFYDGTKRGSRHFLNPSNFGITATLLFFPWVGVVPPYHFSENTHGRLDWLLPAIIIGTGSFLNIKLTRRLPLIAAWLGGFLLQALLRHLFLQTPLPAALMTMTGVGFILFTFYMVTDPSTTPDKPQAQVVFGAAVAAIYGVLVAQHIVFGLFFALTMVCVARGLGLYIYAMYHSHVRTRATEGVRTREIDRGGGEVGEGHPSMALSAETLNAGVLSAGALNADELPLGLSASGVTLNPAFPLSIENDGKAGKYWHKRVFRKILKSPQGPEASLSAEVQPAEVQSTLRLLGNPKEDHLGAYAWFLPVVVGAGLLGLWGTLCGLQVFLPSVLPSPLAVAVTLGEEFQSGRLGDDIVASLFRVISGFLLAVGIGIPIGLGLGHSARARAALLPVVNFLRSLSPLAWIPFAILWFGIGDTPVIFLIFMATAFPITVSTAAAVADIPSVYFRVAQDYGFEGFELLTRVILPAILPEVITALRVTAGVVWLVVVAAEMIAGRDGLGFLIWDARNGLRMDLLVAGMIVIGFLGVLLDRLMLQLTILPGVRWSYER